MTDGNEKEEEQERGDKSHKPRKRMKDIRRKILSQMEFYFSDSNLHKDRFLKKEIEKTEDGYIDISVFTKFNKIRQLTEDVKVIAKALRKSTLLEVNSEENMIRRQVPLKAQDDVDDRTVYVEHLPRHIDHEWVRNLFSQCGTVQYVSLPKFRTTGDLKRFGFVEFGTKEEAERACEVLNNPPPMSGRPGKFPKWNKQLYQLKMKTDEETMQDVETTEKAADVTEDTVQKPCKKHRKRKRHASESSLDGSSDQLQTKKKRSESDIAEESDGKIQEAKEAVSSEDIPKPNRKRKLDSGENSTKKDMSDSVCEGHKLEEEEKRDGKKKKNKKKRLSDVNKSVEEDSEQTDSSATEKTERGKRKRMSDSHNLEAPQAKSSKLEPSVVKTEETNKKKRKRKKKNREKDIPSPQLKVITKQEWLRLRQEYLAQQKTNMTAMKKTLKQQAEEAEKTRKMEESQTVAVKKEGDRSAIEFISGVIVHVSSTAPMNRKTLKECLPNNISVAYFDIKDDSKLGHIRCKDNNSASRLSDFVLENFTFNLLSGDDETQYWNKLTADREEKFNNKKRNKKRGSQKLIEKAHRHNTEVMEKRKHIVFED